MTERARRRPQRHRALASAVAKSKAPAISRAAAVLRALGRSETPLGVQAIARELGLVPSTCLYVLRALVAEEFVAFDPDTKRYALDAGVLTLAQPWLRRNRFNDLAQPALDRIAQSCEVTTLGVQIVGLEHIIVVALAQAGQTFQLSTQIGSRFPALISATGRCIAAFGDHPEAELEERFQALRWDAAPTLEAWKKQVAQTRQQGVAVDAGHYIAGVTVVAAPVWKARGKLSHALVAIGIGNAVGKARLPALQDAVRSAARTITNQLCGEE
ncbi:MAG: IclR family transcriptional regulator [Polyangiales bacterium]